MLRRVTEMPSSFNICAIFSSVSGTSRIFLLDVLLHLALDDQQRCSVAHRTVDRFGEEVSQLENALRGVRELVCDGAAHRRRMHADFFGDILDHHRLQLIDSLVQEFALPPDDRLANFHDDVFPLLDVLQQLHRGLEAVLDVVLDVFVQRIALEHVAVRRTQPKLRNFVFICHDGVLAADFDDENIRLDQARLRPVVLLAGPRVEMLDDLDLLP